MDASRRPWRRRPGPPARRRPSRPGSRTAWWGRQTWHPVTLSPRASPASSSASLRSVRRWFVSLARTSRAASPSISGVRRVESASRRGASSGDFNPETGGLAPGRRFVESRAWTAKKSCWAPHPPLRPARGGDDARSSVLGVPVGGPRRRRDGRPRVSLLPRPVVARPHPQRRRVQQRGERPPGRPLGSLRRPRGPRHPTRRRRRRRLLPRSPPPTIAPPSTR